MSPAFATASPPAARISSTTVFAASLDGSRPSRSTPKSLTTTLAPWRANSNACARPRPRPAPVTITTRPSQIPTRRSPRRRSGRYGTPMHFGVTMFATDLTMPVHELAREAEARGMHSLYIPEHTHIPTSRLTPAPTGTDSLADEYARTIDPFTALAAAAAVTETIRLGT